MTVAAIEANPYSIRIKQWLVGACAGLDFAQIYHVHLFTIAAFYWLLTSPGKPERRVPVALLWLFCAVCLLAATTFLGPLVVSHTLALQLIAQAAAAAVICLRADAQTRRTMAFGLLSVCLFSACWAIMQEVGLLPLRAFQGTEGAGRVMGIYREPDWLGLFCAVGIVTGLGLDIRPTAKVTFVSIFGMALLFTLARTSIIALAVTGVIAVLASLASPAARRVRSKNRRVILVVAALVSIGLVLVPKLSSHIVDRFQSGFVSQTQDVGAQSRTRQLASLRILAGSAPWYGDGLSAAGRVDVNGFIDYGAAPNSGAVSTNWVLGWWIDGKYLALPLILLFCFLAFRFAARYEGKLLLVVLITSLASNAIMLPITWFAVGLCLASACDAASAGAASRIARVPAIAVSGGSRASVDASLP